ncbi:MAG: type II toxin-antitoxin system HipA family toxin [Actinobacteria bacterium]|nr:type II toxin-antitoxin system HipA family toxin [Actinomycetota bacterium]MBI3686896.1 type II toxin-antitoxin system HipA family toxin [Actinomycetota bacterium]
MPKMALHHSNKVVRPFLAGLLPENPEVLRRWGRRYDVSPSNPFALLEHVGDDVAGAAQFVIPDRVDDALQPGSVEPVDAAYIADRLATLRLDRTAWEPDQGRGRFSLAGQQAKFALYRGPDGSWGLPDGRKATTHILKPAVPGLDDHDINEHLCLEAAGHLGILTARSRIEEFHGQRTFVVQRYDRDVLDDGSVERIHQEDMCQALSVRPEGKYEDEGGPSARKIIELLRGVQTVDQARDSVERFTKALIYNWVIAGPDAHAKNYSVLLDTDQVRLAPLYDVSSVLSYPQQYRLPGVELAMSIAGERHPTLITGQHWTEFARRNRLDADDVAGWAHQIASGAPAAFARAISSLPSEAFRVTGCDCV